MHNSCGHDIYTYIIDDDWKRCRESLERVFELDNMTTSLEMCKQLINEHIQATPLNKPVAMYKHSKVLTTQLSIKLFLSHSISTEEAQEISELMTTHWHGIISVPLNIKVPLLQWKSGYKKALTAKERLIEIIREKLKTQPSELASGVQEGCSDDLTVRNILLFISALIPKALASLMTSCLMELSKPENLRYYQECLADSSVIDDVILECQRLWPPFLGGRRLCTENCELQGYAVPKEVGVAYISYIANRDPNVFAEPDNFKPERWRNENVNDKDLIWTFGGGPRCCIGRSLTTVILKEWLGKLLSTLKLELAVGSNTSDYKLIPVCRPNDDLPIIFTPSGNNNPLDVPSNNTPDNDLLTN
jgi:cytochrome P450